MHVFFQILNIKVTSHSLSNFTELRKVWQWSQWPHFYVQNVTEHKVCSLYSEQAVPTPILKSVPDNVSIYSLCVHRIFTIGSLYIHYILTTYSPYVHYIFTVCSLHIHYIHYCSQNYKCVTRFTKQFFLKITPKGTNKDLITSTKAQSCFNLRHTCTWSVKAWHAGRMSALACLEYSGRALDFQELSVKENTSVLVLRKNVFVECMLVIWQKVTEKNYSKTCGKLLTLNSSSVCITLLTLFSLCNLIWPLSRRWKEIHRWMT